MLREPLVQEKMRVIPFCPLLSMLGSDCPCLWCLRRWQLRLCLAQTPINGRLIVNSENHMENMRTPNCQYITMATESCNKFNMLGCHNLNITKSLAWSFPPAYWNGSYSPKYSFSMAWTRWIVMHWILKIRSPWRPSAARQPGTMPSPPIIQMVCCC